MSGGDDPDDRKPMDWSKLGSPIWKKVAELVHFRRKHAQTLGQGSTRMSVTAAGLIKVTRHGDETLTAYFNTQDHEAAVGGSAVLTQGFTNGKLAPKGFMVQVGNR